MSYSTAEEGKRPNPARLCDTSSLCLLHPQIWFWTSCFSLEDLTGEDSQAVCANCSYTLTCIKKAGVHPPPLCNVKQKYPVTIPAPPPCTGDIIWSRRLCRRSCRSHPVSREVSASFYIINKQSDEKIKPGSDFKEGSRVEVSRLLVRDTAGLYFCLHQ